MGIAKRILMSKKYHPSLSIPKEHLFLTQGSARDFALVQPHEFMLVPYEGSCFGIICHPRVQIAQEFCLNVVADPALVRNIHAANMVDVKSSVAFQRSLCSIYSEQERTVAVGGSVLHICRIRQVLRHEERTLKQRLEQLGISTSGLPI